jgi:hypothetical protein
LVRGLARCLKRCFGFPVVRKKMTVPKEVETKKARISGLGITERSEFTSCSAWRYGFPYRVHFVCMLVNQLTLD